MLNLFQHLSLWCSNLEIPKQVRNDRESSPIVIAMSLSHEFSSGAAKQSLLHMLAHTLLLDCFRANTPRNDVSKGSPVVCRDPRNYSVKGSSEGLPSGGGLGVSPSYPYSLTP